MHFGRKIPRIQGVKGVFMDVMGTIMDYSGYTYAGEALYNEFVTSFGVNADVQALYATWTDDWNDAFSKMAGFRTAKETWVAALVTTLSRFGDRASSEVISNLYEMYVQTVIGKTQIYADAISELSKLRDAGFTMGIISDEEFEVVEGVLRSSGLYGLFNFVIVSDKVRGYKNKGEPFRQALKHTLLRPEEMLYIGDSIARDVSPAKAYGFRTVLLARESSGHQVGEVSPDYILPNLKALTVALGVKA
jgi:HAD superfamily hydrolase (TIGR01549 family)